MMVKSPEYDALQRIMNFGYGMTNSLPRTTLAEAVGIASRAVMAYDERHRVTDDKGRILHANEVKDTTDPGYNKRRQSSNPWLIEEVMALVAGQLEEFKTFDDDELNDPKGVAATIARKLWREGLIVLDPNPVPDADEVQAQQMVERLERRARDPDNNFWANDARMLREAAELINKLRPSNRK